MLSLAMIPFFRSTGDLETERFDRRCSWRRFDEGQVILDYEDKSSDVYFIHTGEVRILIRTQGGREVILADQKPGDYFGELAAIDGIPRSANVTALIKAETCMVPGPVFREMLFASGTLCDKVLKLLAGRVRELNARLIEHTVLDVRHRLYSELLRLSTQRAGHPGERVITPPPFHHVLAGRIGCRREQITRELSNMSGDGLLEKTRGALVLKQPDSLRDRISTALRETG